MTFNVSDAPPNLRAAIAQGLPAARLRRRIFIVEDSERLASLLKAFLESRGYEIIIEADGSRAVQRFLAERPDLVVLDLMLPGKDGFQICRELRAIGNTPILVFTTRNDDIDHVLGLELGATTTWSSRSSRACSWGASRPCGGAPSAKARVRGFSRCSRSAPSSSRARRVRPPIAARRST